MPCLSRRPCLMNCSNKLRDELWHCTKHLVGAAFSQLKRHTACHWATIIILIGIGTFGGHKLGELNVWREIRYKLYQSVLGRLTFRTPRPKRTVVVLITDKEFWQPPLDGQSPLKRDYLASLVERIDAGNPAVIALDVDLSIRSASDCDRHAVHGIENTKLLQSLRTAANNRTVVLAKAISYADASQLQYALVP